MARKRDDGGQAAWSAAVHARPEVRRLDEAYGDLMRLKGMLPDDAFVRDHFATVAHRLYILALAPYQETTPLP
jgi:hypothetical protein